MKNLSLSAILLVSWLAGEARAQGPTGLPWPGSFYGHAATAQEAALRAEAEVISAAGENQVNRASAAYIGQRARTIAISNDLNAFRARLAKKKEWQQDRYGARQGQASQASHRAVKLEREQVERLPVELLGASGANVRWPGVLTGDEYQSERNIIEHALTMRAYGEHGATSISYAYALAARERMLTTLRSRIREMSTQQYLATKKFICLVANETLFAPPADLARN